MSDHFTCEELINVFNRIGGKITINYKNKKCTYDNRITVDINKDEYDLLDNLLWNYQFSYYKLATEIKTTFFEKVDKIHIYQPNDVREITLNLNVDERGLKDC
jgi:hypothetical protein